MAFIKQFGGGITPELEARYARSPQWEGSKFENLEETTMDISFQSIPKLLYKQFCEREHRSPARLLEVAPLNWEAFVSPSETAKCIWYGHSAVLMRIAGKTIFIDPMMGPNASPIAPWKTARFTGSLLHVLEQIPEVDIVLLSHDHYDHLDLESFELLKPKTKRWITALGVGRHLEKWGVESEQILELDWWDSHNEGALEITFTPTRHFSGRGPTDRAKSLWGGWVLDAGNEKVYFTGDSGYGEHFKEVGKRLGPFDLGFVECGQYNEQWSLIHMAPEESVQAAIDAGIRKSVPVHWAGFALAMHTWTDPVERFAHSAKEKSVAFSFPEIGQAFELDASATNHWWNAK